MKKLLLCAAIVAVGVGGWRMLRHDSKAQAQAQLDDDEAHLALDRLWIDHIPRNERDTIQVFLALTEQPVGAFQSASMWAGNYELFRYEMRGKQIRAVFPQSGAKESFQVSARTCSEKGMDYCLEIRGSDHGVKRYYSQEGWEVGSVAAEQKLLEAITPRE